MPRTLVAAVLGTSIVLGTSLLRAEPPPPLALRPPVHDQGVSLGLRVGWAFPLGSFESGDRLSANFDGMLPVWLDLGYRLNQAIYIGAYFQWAAAFVNGDLCPGPLSCSATDLRFGANLHWHFLPPAEPDKDPIDPWIGVGAGYEIATTHLSANGSKSHGTDEGFEFVNLQVGADYLGWAPFRLGPFANLSVAEFDRRSIATPTESIGQPIANPAVHLWLMLGVRGQYDF